MVLSRRFFAMRGVLLVMKTPEDERYVVIKAYKCTVSEPDLERFFCITIYCVYVVSLHTESTDSVIFSKATLVNTYSWLFTVSSYYNLILIPQLQLTMQLQPDHWSLVMQPDLKQ